MELKELSAYLTSLLRSEAEVVASFFMGVFLTLVLAFWLRRWISSGSDVGVDLARKDAEIARKDAELARKDVQNAGLEAKLAILERRLLDEENLVANLRRQDATSGDSARYAQLKAENQELRKINQSIEAEAANLRTKLAQAVDEANHWAKWSKVFDEENARLMETGSLREG